MNCFRCDKVLKNLIKEKENHPVDGVAFITYGHYGSKIFDPMDGTYLEINICDDCLEQERLKNKVLKIDINKKVKLWNHKLF